MNVSLIENFTGGFRMMSFSGALLPTAALTLALFMPGLTHAQKLFPDPALEAAVRHKVFAKRDTDEPLTVEDVKDLSQVVARGEGIKSLSGLEHCKRLMLLDLADNQIQDISPIADLKLLQSLTLTNNKIEDISALSGLERLQYAELSGNQISDVSPLQGLEAMRSLYLSGNQIANISALAGMPHLTSLYLDGNRIDSIEVVGQMERLATLSAAGNQIQDVSPLKELQSLNRLNLANNQITDIAPLAGMAAEDAAGEKRFAPYWAVDLSGNPLSASSKSQHLAKLEKHSARISAE